jgi:uncharacterized ParB-like nuclease family protein
MMEGRTLIINLADIKSEGLQVRVAMDTDTVAEYIAIERDTKKELPPVVVFSDKARVYWLADGFHRVEARRQRGEKTIRAKVIRGSRTDALKYALSANAYHGLRRTNADKRRAIEIAWQNRELLGLGEEPSAAVIAEMCGVVRQTVYNVLPHYSTVPTVPTVPQPPKKAPPRARTDGQGEYIPPVPKPPQARPQAVIGGDGKEIPIELLELWGRRVEINDVATSISHIRSGIKSVADDPLWKGLNFSAVLSNLDKLYAEIKSAIPYCTCPMCQGVGCKACVGRGLISQDRYDTIVPEELKK